MVVPKYHLQSSSRVTSTLSNGGSRILQMHCEHIFMYASDQSVLNVNNSLGHSKKGWTDCKLAVIWLTHFERFTARKADGHARLLVVDGHNSHYSFEFLDYAFIHNIHVLAIRLTPPTSTRALMLLYSVSLNNTGQRKGLNGRQVEERFQRKPFLQSMAQPTSER